MPREEDRDRGRRIQAARAQARERRRPAAEAAYRLVSRLEPHESCYIRHMKQVGSDDARRDFRALLNDVEHQGEHITVMRYKTPAAVIVPVWWYDLAEDLMDNRGDRR